MNTSAAITKKSTAGFTLVELCVVIIILGTVIATVATGYQSWQAQVKVETNQERVASTADRINDYKKIHGHFPQPASLTLPRGDANYGYEGASFPAAGTCTNGLCAQNGVDSRKVLIGALPFRELNIPEEESYDVYGSRIIYTVTETATADNFKENQGALRVQNEQNQDLFDVTDTDKFPGIFATFSPGKNRKGGFSMNGTAVAACSGTAADTANCDFLTGATDANFRSNSYSEASSNDYFDDIIAFNRVPEQSSTWRRGIDPDKTGESTDDLIATGEGNIYVGAQRALKSSDGNLSILFDSTAGFDGNMNIRGALKTNSLCDGDDCIRVANLEKTCGAGEYITGFYNGEPQCGPIYFGCKDGEFMIGIKADGTAICKVMDPEEFAGECGSASGQSLTDPPVGGRLCKFGNSGAVTEGENSWSWSCTNGGQTANCSAAKVPPPYNGACGPANGRNYANAPAASDRCSMGTMTAFNASSGNWSWTCEGAGEGSTNASCSANKTVTNSCECGPGNCPTTTPVTACVGQTHVPVQLIGQYRNSGTDNYTFNQFGSLEITKNKLETVVTYANPQPLLPGWWDASFTTNLNIEAHIDRTTLPITISCTSASPTTYSFEQTCLNTKTFNLNGETYTLTVKVLRAKADNNASLPLVRSKDQIITTLSRAVGPNVTCIHDGNCDAYGPSYAKLLPDACDQGIFEDLPDTSNEYKWQCKGTSGNTRQCSASKDGWHNTTTSCNLSFQGIIPANNPNFTNVQIQALPLCDAMVNEDTNAVSGPHKICKVSNVSTNRSIRSCGSCADYEALIGNWFTPELNCPI